MSALQHNPRIDVSALSWCLAEISSALEKTEKCLREQLQLNDSPVDSAELSERSALRSAQAALHQAHGALSVVDITGLTQISEEAERLLVLVADGQLELNEPLLNALSSAFAALTEYSELLVDGADHVPVRLYPYVKVLKEFRSAERIHPADLLYADLTVKPPRMPDAGTPWQEGEKKAVRAQFEQGLLVYLRDSSSDQARQSMLTATARIENAERGSPSHGFWWLALAFFDAMSDKAIANDPWSKRLVARLNLQVRKSLEQGESVVDVLFTDTLFQVARASNPSPFVAQVQQMYRLEGKVPQDYEQGIYRRQNSDQITVFKESLGQVRLSWDRAARGQDGAVREFVQAVVSCQICASELGAKSIANLCATIAKVCEPGIEKDSLAKALNDALQLEITTDILFIDEAVAKRSRIDSEYESRAHDMAERLLKLSQGQALEAMPEWLAKLSGAAQERQTSDAFVGEVLANLRSAEKTLDAYFRDSSVATELSVVSQKLRQAAGALSLLGHTQAAAGASALADEVAQVQVGDPCGEAIAERWAESLSALSFFVEELGSSDVLQVQGEFDEQLKVFKIRHKSIYSVEQEQRAQDSPNVVALPVAEMAPLEQTESPQAVVVDSVPTRFDNFELPSLDLASFDLEPTVAEPDELVSALVADTDPVEALDFGLFAPTPEASESGVIAQTQALSDDQIDAELLEIFLSEAEEVLGHITEARAALEATPGNQEQLTTIRRGFHTLKGSGRMVGLNDFGEAAWSLEQTLNLWLGDQRSATQELLLGVDLAHAEFNAWVLELRANPTYQVNPASMIELGARLRGEGVSDSVPTFDSVVDEAVLGEESIEETAIEETTFDEVVLDEPSIDLALTEEQTVVEPVAFADFIVDEPAVVEPAIVEDAVVAAFDEEFALFAESVDDELIVDKEPIEQDIVDDFLAVDALADDLDTEDALVQDELVDEVIAEPAIDDELESAPLVPAIGLLAAGVGVGVGVVAHQINANPLFQIFIAEADGLLATLYKEVHEFVNDSAHVAREPAIRSAHSLGGSGLVVGLPQVSQIAYHLETWMMGQRKLAKPAKPGEAVIFQTLVDKIAAALHQFAAGNGVSDQAQALALAAEFAAPHVDPSSSTADSVQVVDAFANTEPLVSGLDEDQVLLDLQDLESVSEETIQVHRFADDLDPELFALFTEEAKDYLPAIGADLRQWENNPADTSFPQSLLRALHTVKGSARMAGAMRLGDMVHEMETRIESVSHLTRLPDETISKLIGEYDQVIGLFEQMVQSDFTAALPSNATQHNVASVQALVDTSSSRSMSEPSQNNLTLLSSTAPALPPANNTASAGNTVQQLIRVRADLLDRMVNEAGEVSIARSRMENEIFAIKGSLGDLTENVHRLRSQLREIEIQAESQIQARVQTHGATASFDPLEFDRFTRFQELTRMMAESVNDVATVQNNLAKSLNEASVDLTRQAQVTRDLQQNLMRVRMVQFGSISDRLYRVVRQAGKDAGKRVNLEIRGTAAEIDRSVLERISGPLEHLLRNAVGHGIESTDSRVLSGKSETGEITAEVRQEGNEVVLTLSDDGAGLNFKKIRERALQSGLLTEGSELNDRELAELIFMPGFSTANELTALSGRGIGMDVVRSEVAALGGRIETHSELGKGTRFVIHLPLTLAVTQVVIVLVGDQKFAVPSVLVEQVVQLKPQALAQVYEQRSMEWHGKKLPCEYLGKLLSLADATPVAQRYSPILILRSGSDHAAVHVDAIVGNQEVVVKNLGPQLSRLQGVAGATVLGNGEIVLIMNPVQVFKGNNYQSILAAQDNRSGSANTDNALRIPRTVMVVDDSLTVRKVSQRFLLRENYQVILAKDGVDALRQLQDIVPDVMMVDIEMPRMDGFDLTRNIRADERLKHVPIIMITSRTADKHRNHAMSLGVNVFLGKPFSEDQLIAHLRQLTEAQAVKPLENELRASVA